MRLAEEWREVERPDVATTCSRTTWCQAMAVALEEEANPHRKGFSVYAIETRNHNIRVIGIVYKKAPADRGVFLNKCPWCGRKILWETSKEEMQRARERDRRKEEARSREDRPPADGRRKGQGQVPRVLGAKRRRSVGRR